MTGGYAARATQHAANRDAELRRSLRISRLRLTTFFAGAASNNASADTSLKRRMKLSLYPAAGVVAGLTASASLAFATPLASAS